MPLLFLCRKTFWRLQRPGLPLRRELSAKLTEGEKMLRICINYRFIVNF